MTKFVAISRLSLHQLTLAAVSLTLTYDAEKHDIIVGAPYLNRVSEEEMKTVGLFLQPLPIRIRYPDINESAVAAICSEPRQPSSTSPTVDPFLLTVRKQIHSALSHPIQWHQLLTSLKLIPDHPNHPLFDVMVTFHELESQPMLPIQGVKPLYTWTQGAKFKLMVEAQAVSKETLMIRFEYDEGCFSEKEIELLQNLLMLALDHFSAGLGLEHVKARLGNYVKSGGGNDQEILARNFFAEPLESF